MGEWHHGYVDADGCPEEAASGLEAGAAESAAKTVTAQLDLQPRSVILPNPPCPACLPCLTRGTGPTSCECRPPRAFAASDRDRAASRRRPNRKQWRSAGGRG